ncbi:MAG: LuxR C-terminal-related transcriptional regulator [Cyanobacteria bacterium P01_F01_bin.150]
MLNNKRLVWDLQRANQVAQRFSSSLDVEEIAHLATDGLVHYFECTFARIWLVKPDQKQLRLVASSGLYTQTNGSFSRIPIGDFKIGQIAQNRVSLLSNNLAEESWVQYPQWALENNLKSFAGYPLVTSKKVIGVLATFSSEPMSLEFLEVLSSLCTTLTVALEIASLHHKETQTASASQSQLVPAKFSLSDNLSYILDQTNITVIGTERELDLAQIQLFLKVAEKLKPLDCIYCRLTYNMDSVSLNAIAATHSLVTQAEDEWEQVLFGNVSAIASCFGGIFKFNTEASIKTVQISLSFPASVELLESPLRIQCHLPLLQTGFTQLAYNAGFSVQLYGDRLLPLLTDQTSLLTTSDYVIWVNHTSERIPYEAKALVDLSTTPSELREAVKTVIRGETWGFNQTIQASPKLSHREQEVITLLTKGLRDREIAEQLYISDSTVKFHINNIVAKLEAKTRMQALYTLMKTGGLEP